MAELKEQDSPQLLMGAEASNRGTSPSHQETEQPHTKKGDCLPQGMKLKQRSSASISVCAPSCGTDPLPGS